MKYCSHCGTATRQVTAFCSNCGASLAEPQGPVCPVCHSVNAPGAGFCTSCARPLPRSESSKLQSRMPIKALARPVKPLSSPGPEHGTAKLSGPASALSSAPERPAEPPPTAPVDDEAELFPMDAEPAPEPPARVDPPAPVVSLSNDDGPALPAWLIQLRNQGRAVAQATAYRAAPIEPTSTVTPRWFEAIRPPELYRRPERPRTGPEHQARVSPESPETPGPADPQQVTTPPERLKAVDEEPRRPQSGPISDSHRNVKLAIARLTSDSTERTAGT